MVLERFQNSDHFVHKRFYNILEELSESDCLVINDTRVIPARLIGRRQDSGGKVEFLLLRPFSDNSWEVLVKPGRRARAGMVIDFAGKLQAKIKDVTNTGGRIVEFVFEGEFEEVLNELGKTPLPPYINEELDDSERYQTVYSSHSGSVAAPTAGLHFTEELLEKIKEKGIAIVPLTLHVGIGTFRPVQTENIEEHVMHSEYYYLSEENAAIINERKQKGGGVVAVGTTTARTLETLANDDGSIKGGSGWTDIYIYPGYRFKIIDALITNFHLPRSSLLMLVSAFAGVDTIRNAYHEAIENNTDSSLVMQC